MTALKNKFNLLVLFAVLAVMMLAAVPMQTLDVAALIDTPQMFANANILIAALGGVVLVIVGFNLAKLVIRFVLNIFNSFSI